jgi:N-acetylglucosaminyldiphosphoundecaprenol N-acetyl-beta-D-mannosaminyltransferase
MMLTYKKVLGYQFVNSSMDELVDEVCSRIVISKKTFIVTANPEIITYAYSDPRYQKILKSSDFVIPDGAGIIVASKILHDPLKERLAGFDLMERLLQAANQNHYRVYFLGTKPSIIPLAVERINLTYPNIEIVGFHHGYFHGSGENIAKEAAERNPDLIFVGLGFPKQETWISDHLHYFSKGVFMGGGGCLNVWAGVDKRAPKVWRDLNLEWCYRLIKQPSRTKRMKAIPVFLKRVIRKEFE